jgi:hypothetical protein
MKGAEDNVVCEPNEQKPARPVPATKHERSGKKRDEPDEDNPNRAIIKQTISLELGSVVCESDSASCYEQPTDNGD